MLSKKMRRRDFIKNCSLTLMASVLPFRFFPGVGKYGVLLQPFENKRTGQSGILSFDFNTGLTHQINTKFNVHNIHWDEGFQEFIAINRYGQEYLKFRDPSFRYLKYFRLNKKFHGLSGHVSSVPGDDFYYLTGFDLKTGANCILSLNKKNEDCSVEVSLAPSQPPVHDCKFGQNQNELVFTASNKVHFFNRITKKLRSQPLQLEATNSSLRHFSINSNDEICLQSNVIHTGGSDYKYESGEVVSLKKDRMDSALTAGVNTKIKDNELLDFSFDKSGQIFACVHGGSACLTIWQNSPFNFKKLVQFDESIVRVSHFFDEPYFLVMGRENFYLVSTETFQVERLKSFRHRLSKNFGYSHKTLIAGL